MPVPKAPAYSACDKIFYWVWDMGRMGNILRNVRVIGDSLEDLNAMPRSFDFILQMNEEIIEK